MSSILMVAGEGLPFIKSGGLGDEEKTQDGGKQQEGKPP